MTGRFDSRRHDATFWEPRLAELAPDLSKPALAVARQRLVQWCAQNGGGLTATELRTYLEDVQSVLAQAGIRQGVVRRPLPTRGADESPPSRPRLRVIK